MKNLNIKGAHVIMYYALDEQIKDLLYKTEPPKEFITTKNGEQIGKFQINEDLRGLMEQYGYKFKKPEIRIPRAIKKIYGVHVDIAKKHEGGKWTEIMVHVLGNEHEESTENAKLLKTLILKKTGIVPVRERFLPSCIRGQ